VRRLISFDIDGTLESGDPPGRITMEMVRRAQELGYIIGSASDRPVPVQQGIWERHGITVEFTIHKHNLNLIKAQFEADEYKHIGDTNMDEMYALMHGFEYLDVAKHTEEPWMMVDGAPSVLVDDQLAVVAVAVSDGAAEITVTVDITDVEAVEIKVTVDTIDIMDVEVDDSTQDEAGAQALARFWAQRAKRAADEANA
jgi:hypothetical protein